MPTVEMYPADPLYPRIVRAVDAILARGKTVAPVDVLIGMHLLTPERLEDWRRGRVPYLEKVILCNLTRLSRLLRILRFHAHDLKLVPTVMVYMRWTKGPKQRLRFHQDRGSEAQGSVCAPFRLAGQGPLPPTCAKGGARMTARCRPWRSHARCCARQAPPIRLASR